MRLKLSLLLVFIITYSWSQSGSTKTFTGNGTFPVPAGVTSVTVQAWGGGGSGGGASGAPLLLGRGSAGGGGGAYASAPLLVTPGTTLNVVVASQTSGTSGAGTAGGNSTITGFETSILAAGGSGGSANNAGGSPIGGIGGSVAASAGSTKLAGANGGNGNSWNLLGLLLSSGAGGSGANSGGAGGTAVSGLILSNAPGNAGSPPGGAGSGAINSALGASQIGGAGAAGRVIISYSCANFSLTSTAATNFCASIGTTSTVTLTGNAASLPIGNYVVTYNRSSPVATALTANLTVSTAGTGTFTAVGLTTGSSTITVTKLASETCSSNITANNTATITISPATVGGTVAGGTTINAGNTSGLLTLSGHTGSVVKWQSSVSPFSVWTDLANTNTTYTSGVLTETTQFRAVVQSGSCTVVNSAATTVTVEALPTIALQSQAQGICSFNNGTTLQTTLGYTATTGTPVTYSIVWNSSPANGFTAITDAALPTSPIILYFPAATAAGIYTGTLTVKNASGSSSLGSVFNVFIDRSPSITSTGAIAWVTSSNNSQNTTLAYSASVENPTRYSIDWNSAANAALLTDQLSTLFAFSPGGGVINNIVIPANVPSGTYSGTINIMNAGSCSASRSVTISIFAAVAPTIALASSTENRCYVGSNVSQTTTLEYSGTTGSPITYSIVWNASPTNSLVPVTDAALQGSPITIAIPTGTNPGTYTGTLTVKNANGAVSTGSTFTLSLGFLATILSDGSIASVTTSSSPQTATLAYSGLSPSSGTPPTRYFIDWDQTANNALLADQPTTSFAFSFSGGSINNIVIPANVPAGTYTGAMYISNEASCNQYKNVSITVSAPVAPTIALASSAAERCPFSNITTLEYSGTTGSPITYSIVWNASPANIFAAVTDAPLPASPILIAIPVGTDSGTYTGTLTVKNADGIESLGSVFALNVKQAPSIISNDIITPVSTTTSIQYTTLAYSGIIANPTQYSLIWDQPAMQNRPMEPFTFSPAGGVIDNIIIPANVPPGTYTGIMTFFNGDCFGKHNVSIVINSQAPTIALASSAAERCSHINVAQTTTLEYSGTTGSPITYSIVWNASPANTFAAVTDAALPASPISIAIPAGTDYGTYTGTLTVKNADGTVSNPGSTFTVSLGSVTAITTNGIIATVASRSSLQNTSLKYLLNFGSVSDVPTKYSIDWDQTANNALLADQPTTSFDVMLGTSIPNIVIPANVPAGTYTGVMYVSNESTCSQSINVSITISTAPTIVLSPLAEDICTDINGIDGETILEYSETTGDPVTYSIVWDSSPSNSFETVIDQEFPTPVFSIIVPAGTVAGTYTGTLTVKNADGIESLGSVFALNVKQTASIISNDIITPVSTSTSIQYTTLAYSGTIGNPTECFLAWDQPTVIHNQFFEPSTFSSSGGVIDIIISANVPPGTYTGIMTFFNGDCYGAHNVSIVINSQAPTIALASSAKIVCISGNYHEDTTLNYAGTTGNPVTYSIVWDSFPENDFFTITDAVLPASPISITLPYATTDYGTYTGTLTVKDANGVSSTGSTFTVSVEYKPTIEINAAIHEVNTSPNAQLTTLVYGQSLGNSTSYSIDWDQNANDAFLQDQHNTAYEFELNGGLLDSVQVSGGALPGSYTGTLHIFNGTECSGDHQVSIVINSQTPTIDLVSSTNFCQNDSYDETSTILNYTGTTGNPVTYSIVWNASPENDFEAVTDAVLPVSQIVITVPEGTQEGSYTGILTVKDANGVSSTGSNFSINIGVIPAITIYEPIYTVCTSPNAQLTTLVYDQSTGNSTSYYIDWNQTANDAGLQDQASTANTFTDGGVINTIQVSGNAQAGTYSGTIYILDGFCSSYHSVSITINAAPTALVIGEITPEIDKSESGGGSIALSGFPEGEYTLLIVQTEETFTISSENITISNLLSGEYSFIVTNAAGCSSPESEIAVVPGFGRNTAKSITAPAIVDSDALKNPITVSAFNKVINVETPNQIIDKVYIFDVSGNLIYEKDKVSDAKLVITDLRSGNQVLVVKVILNNGRSETRKVIF